MFLKLAQVNVISLLANFIQLRDYILSNDFDIVGVTETWLHDGVDEERVKVDRYTFIRQDRLGRRGGGVGMFIKNDINFNILFRESSEYVDHIWIKILLQKTCYVIGNLYRPPNSNSGHFFNSFEDTLTDIYTNYEHITCLGDFNINMLDLDSELCTRLNSIIDVFSLRQLICEPTRISNTSISLIDLIFTNVENVIEVGVVDALIADHFAVFCKIELSRNKCLVETFSFRALKSINFENFQNDLESIPWHYIYDMDRIDDKVDFLNKNIIQLFDKHAPIKTLNKSHRPYSPWITDNIKLLQRLRSNALSRFKNSKSPHHWAYYKQIRNYTTAAIKSEKKAYLAFKFRNCSVKDKWTELKKLNIGKNSNSTIPDNLNNVDELNKFFTSSGNSASPKLNLLNYYADNIKNNLNNLFSFEPTTDLEVLNIIQNIKSRASGRDQLNIVMIHLCCPFILPFLTHILNECISKSYFPTVWKQAYVLPLPKITSPTEFNHLRSISVLPTFSKILEKIMESQIKPFLDSNSILPKKQSGFRSGYSCASALADITDDILRASDDNKVSVLILLDYSKAFDMLNHDILLRLLHFIGFCDSARDFMTSFLSDRTQQVIIGNKKSNVLTVRSGVPQGSVLGPILFSIYTSCFHEFLQFCNYHLYADDTQLYCSFKIDNLEHASNMINNDLNILYNISNDHLLKINPSKSSVLLFGNKNFINAVMAEVQFKIGDSLIPYCNCSKSLGLVIDCDLRFKNHVTYMLKKAYTSLKMIYCHRHYLGLNTKILLCDTLVLSHFNHCDSVYGPCLDSGDIRRIQKVQNSCLRLIFGIRSRQRISHKLNDAKWLNMYNRRKLHMTLFFYKIIKYKSPSYLHDKISYRTDVHNVNVRRKNLLTIPRHNKQLFKRSFSYNIATCINSVDMSNLTLSTLTFKHKYKKWLLQNQ